MNEWYSESVELKAHISESSETWTYKLCNIEPWEHETWETLKPKIHFYLRWTVTEGTERTNLS